LKITFIGTGSGKASLNRFHSSLLISAGGYNLLVDAGDSISRALLSRDLSCNSINGILISHLHPDHSGGFAALIVQMKMNNRKEPLEIFVHHTLIGTLKNFLSFSYIFAERMGFPIHFAGFNFDDGIQISGELYFIAKKNSHLEEYEVYDPSLSYASASFLFKSGDNIVCYSGDLGSPDDLYLFKDYKADIFITEAAHVSYENILEMTIKLKPGKVILTHLAEDGIPGINPASIINDSMIIARDGLIVSVE